MHRLSQLVIGLLFVLSGIYPSAAAFTSFHVFGDSLSCTASNTTTATNLYHGKRYSNGRVWVEALALMVTTNQNFFNPSNNPHSFFGNTSSNLFAQITNYTATLPPSDASNALVVIWVNNADLYYPALYHYSLSQWTNTINASQTNHFKAITNLYAKGVRTLLMPNVVDVSTIPYFNQDPSTNLIHQQCLAYNTAFNLTLSNAMASCSGLTIYNPDYFTVLKNLLSLPSIYGVTNATQDGYSIDAIQNLGNPSLTNGPGTNYIFWDDTNPTAKVHYTMAGVANAMLAPPVISGIVPVNGSNRLDLVNLPKATAGATNCLVLFATNLNQTVWQTNLPGFTSLSTTQSVLVPIVGDQRFYRLKSKLDYNWPWVWP